jgi:hypothetical protein
LAQRNTQILGFEFAQRNVGRAMSKRNNFAELLRLLNVTIPRHAGVNNSSFLPLALNHPIGSARNGLHGCGCSLAFALRKRCLLLRSINCPVIGGRILRSSLSSAAAQHERHRYPKCPHVALPGLS